MMEPNEVRLGPDFQFSQSSLQDFVDCPRRFRLRYLQRLAWPALETEPVLENERFLQKGNRFHRLVQQHLLGLPAERLEMGLQDPELARWWANYQAGAAHTVGFQGLQYPPDLFPETSLSADLGAYRLTAKYDLLVKQADGRWLIVDWKTSRKRPRREWLHQRLQTVVYPYLLARVGARWSGAEIDPQAVEMVYWFADFPQQPERIPYSAAKFQADEDYLQSLLARIERLVGEAFNKTERRERCAYCVYRSLCNRGWQAGPLDDYEAAGEAGSLEADTLDFDQVAEIEF